MIALLFFLLALLGFGGAFTFTGGWSSYEGGGIVAPALPGLPPEFASHTGWQRLNAKPIPPRDADPHRSTKNVYASDERIGGLFPDGTMIVKEGVRPGADFVGLIATMRKEVGANPDHHDWVFVEWTRASPDEPFRKLAAGAVCTSCHMRARASDYVFTAG